MTVGSTPTVTINVWDKTYGSTYSAVGSLGSYYATATITLPPLGPDASGGLPPYGTVPNLPLPKLVLTLLVPTPEPSVYALAALGLGGLFLVSRRK